MGVDLTGFDAFDYVFEKLMDAKREVETERARGVDAHDSVTRLKSALDASTRQIETLTEALRDHAKGDGPLNTLYTAALRMTEAMAVDEGASPASKQWAIALNDALKPAEPFCNVIPF